MLFSKKKCPQCQSSYDVVEDTCPVCHTRDKDFETYSIPKNLVWLPIYKQVLLFVFGLVLLNVISLILEILLAKSFEGNTTGFLMLVNGVRYLVVLLAMLALIFGHFHKFKSSFTKWYPYLIGIGGGIALFMFSLIYGNILNIFYPTSGNDNQATATSLMTTYPILSIFLLGIIGPVVEELTYRVGLFTLLTRLNKAAAYAVTIVVFALIHFDFFAGSAGIVNELLNLPSYVFAGALLCVLYHFFGLSSSMTAHIFNNLLSCIIAIVIGMIS